MTNEEIFAAIATALDVEAEQITIDTQSSDIEEWDSLGHLSILMGLDTTFDGDYQSDPRLASAVSVRDIVEVLTGSK